VRINLTKKSLITVSPKLKWD